MNSSMTLSVLIVLTVNTLLMVPTALAADDSVESASGWQSPSEEILEVLHAPQLPRVWTAPTGEYLLLADPVSYPPLAELAAPMHKLAGIRVNPVLNGIHGRYGGTSPRLAEVVSGAVTPLPLPADAEVLGVDFTADGQRFALTVRHSDHIGLGVGSVAGSCWAMQWTGCRIRSVFWCSGSRRGDRCQSRL
jgi:hypothetical protein